MKPAPFRLLRPETLDEAVSLLFREDDAVAIAGGQSLTPMLNARLAAPEILVDISRLPGLSGIAVDAATGELVIGALTTQAAALAHPLAAERAPLLAAGLSHVGHVQTRSRGTLGGSLAHADPSAEIALCCAALDATLAIHGPAGRFTRPARGFQLDALTPDLGPGELIVEIRLPPPPDGARAAFKEIARRRGDFAIVAAALTAWPGGATAALGGLEATPRLLPAVAAALAAGDAGALPGAIAADLAGAEPLSDLSAGAAYRLDLAAAVIADAARELMP